MEPMQLCIFSRFEGTLEVEKSQLNATNATLLLLGHFEGTFEDAQWRKVIQMHPVRLCFLF